VKCPPKKSIKYPPETSVEQFEKGHKTEIKKRTANGPSPSFNTAAVIQSKIIQPLLSKIFKDAPIVS